MKNLKKGFTIIEMVIVIAIIGILASVLIPTYGNVVNSAHVSAAQQTARASMMDWLATFTANAKAVPQTYTDDSGNKVYYAYFEVTEGGHLYQYRYDNGGIERTDDKVADYKNFASMDSVKGVYLTNGAAAASNKVDFYRMSGQNSSYIYYMKYTHGADNGFGSADVYAVVPKEQTYYPEMNAANSVMIVNTTWTSGTTANTPSYDLELTVGANTGNTLNATIPAGAGDVSWTSDTASVATVAGTDGTGTVTAVAAGTAKITCSWAASATVEAGSQVFNVKINAAG